MNFEKLFACFLTLIVISCKSKPKVHYSSNCFIKYDSLFKIIDTSHLEIIRGTDSAAIEVLDDSSKGLRGLLRFDNNGNLRSYFLLQNPHHDASFFLKYDSSGNHYRSSNSEVVQWLFYNTKDSTIKFTFLLCALDRNYANISIKSGKYNKDHIVLYVSKFTKLICATISINKSDLDSTKKIYIRGNWQDKCSKEENTFIDSAIAY